jgi:hypothetical protein
VSEYEKNMEWFLRQCSRPLGAPFDPVDSLNRAIADRRVRIECCERLLQTRVNARVIADKQYHEMALRDLERERDRRQIAAKGPSIAPQVPDESQPAAARPMACKKEPKKLPSNYRQREDEMAGWFRPKSPPTSKQLKVLTLKNYYGWSDTEIGAHLGMHRKTVDGHIVAAKKKLRPATKQPGAASDK